MGKRLEDRNAKLNEYSTITGDEGSNYREIAETMTALGHKMNHSSARNHIIRVMKKFVDAYAEQWGIDVDEVDAYAIARSVEFQQAIADSLEKLELMRRNS